MTVQTPKDLEGHFWNVLVQDGVEYHIDLTWKQFPNRSAVNEYKFRDRNTFNDRDETKKRIDTLLKRVMQYLNRQSNPVKSR